MNDCARASHRTSRWWTSLENTIIFKSIMFAHPQWRKPRRKCVYIALHVQSRNGRCTAIQSEKWKKKIQVKHFWTVHPHFEDGEPDTVVLYVLFSFFGTKAPKVAKDRRWVLMPGIIIVHCILVHQRAMVRGRSRGGGERHGANVA